VCRYFAETIQKYGVPEIFIRSRVNTPVSSHQCIIKQWNKISMDGKGLLTTFLLKDYGGQSENVYLQAYTDGISLYRGLNYF
jgi:hypothetical protein